MRHEPLRLSLWLAVAVLGLSEPLRAETATPVLALGNWVGCPAPHDPVMIPMLCSKPASGIDRSVHRLLTEILNAGVGSKAALCVIDNAIIRSQLECLSGRGANGVFTMADLMIRLAYSWKQQGALDRAEELARHANALLQAVGEEDLLRMSALRAWAIFQMDRGELQHAVELTDLQIALARRWHDAVRDSPGLLIEALELKAMILEKLGRSSDAQAAREEAEKLKPD